VIQIINCLLILCHQRRDNFSAPNATICIWRPGSDYDLLGGANSAHPDSLAGYRGAPQYPLGKERRGGM